ncbi:MAG TPA: hypothetical protein VFZ59_14965 [Verrucomicrobiae bacterium]|nr:hypothetical protein [Verrucomicrobiae bacterium]
MPATASVRLNFPLRSLLINYLMPTQSHSGRKSRADRHREINSQPSAINEAVAESFGAWLMAND